MEKLLDFIQQIQKILRILLIYEWFSVGEYFPDVTGLEIDSKNRLLVVDAGTESY